MKGFEEVIAAIHWFLYTIILKMNEFTMQQY